MADDVARCSLCGEPMPEGEEMFKYHGYSGDCPKPPLEQRKVIAEYAKVETRDGEFWIETKVNGAPHDRVGPFATDAECQAALDDLLAMMRSAGARDGSAVSN